MNSTKACVLIAPLNWGLGHASRCIPLVYELLKHDCKVVLCGNGASLNMLAQEFPSLETVELHNYNIKYSQSKSTFLIKMILSLPAFFLSIRKDKKSAKQIAKHFSPLLIISDNRYGFKNKDIPSVLITHQIHPLLPHSLRFMQNLFLKRMHALMRDFNHIWVPDYNAGPNLSGILSHNTSFRKHVTYCGHLSRLQPNRMTNKKEYDVMCIISGPEPQRSIFETYCLKLAESHKHLQFCIAAGNTDIKTEYSSSNIDYFSHPQTQKFEALLSSSACVVCRSGYSTIMDLFSMGKKAILIPTPGQTEQQYLAAFHHNKGQFLSFNPETDSFEESLKILMQLPEPKIQSNNVLQQVMKELLDSINKTDN